MYLCWDPSLERRGERNRQNRMKPKESLRESPIRSGVLRWLPVDKALLCLMTLPVVFSSLKAQQYKGALRWGCACALWKICLRIFFFHLWSCTVLTSFTFIWIIMPRYPKKPTCRQPYLKEIM